VIVGSDTAESWRVSATEIAFRVPAVYTGNYDATIRAEGYDPANAALFVVGQAYPQYSITNPYSGTRAGAAAPSRGFLIAESGGWPGFTTGYKIVDVQSRSAQVISGMPLAPNTWVKMYAPGPSYRGNHFVLDLSQPGTSGPAVVWDANKMQVMDSVPCVARDFYTAAEIGPGVCVHVDGGIGTLIRNGVDTILPWQDGLREATFRMAIGGEWTVMRSALRCCSPGSPLIWPVIDRTGRVAYTIDSLYDVTGADFSASGDTLFATVGLRPGPANSAFDDRFALLVLETATARTIATHAFPEDRLVGDVLVDPVRPVIYVAGVRARGGPFFDYRQYLTVLDRTTLDVIADIPAASGDYSFPVAVVYNGGRVHVLGWCGFDCALVVTPYDLP
jgi:hypothetical protein